MISNARAGVNGGEGVLFDFSAGTAQTSSVEKATEHAHPRPTGRPEAWHRLGAGGFLRDVVLGSSDGLVAVLAFVAGVSATLGARRTILLAGLAEMFAGAASMGLGAFLGSKSQREFYRSELLRELHEIAEMPREEREEIRQIYGKKGFQGKDLDMVVDRITEDKDRWLKVMMHEELGFPDRALESPWKAGLALAISYIVGAAVPIWPYLFLEGKPAFLLSGAATLTALFAVGAAKASLTRRPWWKAGIEMSAAGGMGAGVCYLISKGIASL
jgi:VIT1/CCC1 family predicted Fe2+/Mn2+ transporter